MARTRVSVLERILRRAVRSGECLIWTGADNGNGYGVIGDENRRSVYVHRVIAAHHLGPIPPNIQVMHSCDVRPCVEPTHLSFGTKRENEDDKVRKGRASRGEARWSAKLTEDDVRSIRRDVAAGARRADQADRYGVSLATVDLIVTRKRWKHVE